MSVTVALGFPVLDEVGASFADGVRYTVAARIKGATPPRILTVEHRVSGTSFIRDWVRSGDARLSTRLLFRNSARREAWLFDNALEEAGDALVAKHQIPIRFFDTPQIACSIVATENRQLVVRHPESGLTDFWREGERINIPRYARIGHHAILNFDDGSLAALIHVVEEKDLKNGQMKTVVREHAPEAEKPVTLICATDVFDELRTFRDIRPSTHKEALKSAILTQALCAIYSHMETLTRREDYDEEEISPALRSHGQDLKEKTDTVWGEGGFNPSLVATQMLPYAILKNNNADDEG